MACFYEKLNLTKIRNVMILSAIFISQIFINQKNVFATDFLENRLSLGTSSKIEVVNNLHKVYVNGEISPLENDYVVYKNTIYFKISDIRNIYNTDKCWFNNGFAIIGSEENFVKIPIFKMSLEEEWENIALNEDIAISINEDIYIPFRLCSGIFEWDIVYFPEYKEIQIASNGNNLPEESQSYKDYIEEMERELDKELKRKEFVFSEEAENHIDSVIASYAGNNISVYYKDLISGYTYTNNEHRKYFIASVVKAPFCMYVYDMISQGVLDINTRYKYNSSQYAAGSGVIRYHNVGNTYSIEELLKVAIVNSDNIALKILRDNLGTAGYTDYWRNLGLNYPEDIKNITGANFTAIDAGVYIEEINNFIQNNVYGETLREHMLSTSNPLIVSQFPVVRKYGWYDDAFHDIAIVEATNPYLLCILTDAERNTGLFRELTRLFELYSQEEDRNI